MALACDDLTGYLREFRTLLPCAGPREQAPEVAAALAAIAAAVDGHDVAVFKKVGCGFCAHAATQLETLQTSADFTMTSVVATGAAERSALELTLGLPTITFPSIFVKGVFVGGADDLQELVDEGSLPELLAATSTPLQAGSVPVSEQQKRLQAPQLCRAPGGGRWWQPMQLTCYANQIRLVSFVHVVIFSLSLLLIVLGQNVAAIAVMSVLAVDAVIFILHGASPFGPLGVITTRLCWRWRGSAVTSIPYKVVWGIYLGTLVPMILLCGGEDGPWSGCAENLDTAAHKASLTLFIVNSGSLAALRF